MTSKIAVVQKPPVMLDRAATLELVNSELSEAAANGAALVVFPETYVPGYPAWVWRLQPGRDMALAGKLHGTLRENAINLATGDLDPVCQAAWRHKVTVVLGLHEMRDDLPGTPCVVAVVVVEPGVWQAGELCAKHVWRTLENGERFGEDECGHVSVRK